MQTKNRPIQKDIISTGTGMKTVESRTGVITFSIQKNECILV